MRSLLVVGVFTIICYSCNNESNSTKNKLDSIGEKIDTTLDKAWDSTKLKAKELKDKIETKLEKRDSVKIDTSAPGSN